MKRLLALSCLFVFAGASLAFAASEAELATAVENAIKEKKLEAADEAFATAIKEQPDSVRINSLRYSLFIANYQGGRQPAGIEYLKADIAYQMSRIDLVPATANSIPNLVNTLSFVQERDEKYKPTAEVFDQYLKGLAEKATAKPGPELTVAIAELTATKVSWLVNHDQTDAARALLTKELADAAGSLEKSPKDIAAVLRMNAALRTQSQFADDLSPGKEQASRDKYLAFLAEQVQAHRDDIRIVGAYIDGHLNEAQGLALTSPEGAEKLIATVKDFVKAFENPNAVVKQRLTNAERSFPVIAKRIENARAHLALVGQKAAIPEAHAWLNGAPLSAGALQGKVILLDFWAVWCGPCIATFPHLREWHEKFADKGLVIIGVTKYYSYDWDSESNKIKREKDLSNELECAATEKFLQFHKLKHHIAVMEKGSKFDDNYLVNGIPQAVLIDRQGNVRLIRVGSGKKNARDLERTIEELIAAPAAAPAGGK